MFFSKKTSLILCLALLTACSSEPESSKKTFDTDNKSVVNESKQLMNYKDVTPAQVREHMAEYDAEIVKIKGFDFSDKASVAKQSRKMLALRDKPMPYGESLLDKPYGYCGAAGTFALDYWQKTHGNDIKFAKDALKQYEEYKKACLEAVANVEQGKYKG